MNVYIIEEEEEDTVKVNLVERRKEGRKEGRKGRSRGKRIFE